MPLFTPPTSFESSSDHFFGRFKIEVGLSVVKVADHYVTMPYPWLGTLAPLTEGRDYFLGGRTYTVDSSVASALEADGYTTTPVEGEEPSGFGAGGFGEGGFGD